MILWALACTGASEVEPRGPTVVVVIGCTLRADRLHLYGHTVENTPYLDQLAEEGVVFERTLAAAPWTKPAIASLISGRYPVELGIDDPGPDTNTERGVHPDVHTLAERFSEAGWSTLGATANPNANAVFGFAQGFDDYHEAVGLWRDGFEKVGGEEVVETWLARAAQETGPVFGQLVLIDTHAPRAGRGSETVKYDKSVRALDDALRALDDGLAEQGRSERLLVLVGDHGEGLSLPEWAGHAHGTWLYEPTLHVPWLLHGTGVAGGRRIGGIAEGIDLAPTVLELSGLGTEGLSGHSRSAQVQQADQTTSPETLTLQETRFGTEKRQRVTTPDWVFIRNRARGRYGNPRGDQELYATGDTWQATNLADQHPDVVARLAAALTAKREPLSRSPLVWEREEALDEAMIEQLEALGYVDGGEHD